MLEPWQIGKVIKIEWATPNTKRFWIQIPELREFNFTPGQFVTLDLPIHEKKNKRWRSYSIASWPDGTNVLELVIVLLEGGAGTTYLFNEVVVGAEILLRGPQGVFTLPENIEEDLFLICTGTGIAPFRSMVHHLIKHQINHEDIYLIFGCRYIQDLLYDDELRLLASIEPRFHYLPIFSRETDITHPKFTANGYVHNVYCDLLVGKKKPAQFYLCGWKNMIDDARKSMVDLGYDKKVIHFELYG